MNKSFLKGKTVTVFGLGLHGGGIGTVKFLATQEVKKIIVTDLKSKNQLRPSLQQLADIKNIEYVLGQHRKEDFIQTDMVIKTPVISWNNKYIKIALKNNVVVETDSSLFFQLCKIPIIGVTGSKGKTSVATMISDILKATGKKVVSVGISQISVLDKLLETEKAEWVVFELSSWRLSALKKIKRSPHISIITNIFPDHLNYYKNMEEYIADKKNIFLYQNSQDWLIYNEDNQLVKEMVKEADSKLIAFSLYKKGQFISVFKEKDFAYLNNGIDEKKIIQFSKINIKEKHNQANLLAVIGAVYAAGIPLSLIKKAVRKIKKIPDRLELVKEIKGVKYYNDSTATIPEAVQVALRSFSEKIILITGGTDKNLNFDNLAKDIIEKTKGVIFLKGTATDKLILSIKKILQEKDKEFEVVDTMDKAVELASRIADKGDVVLLSPGAASFGLFNNEFHRGAKFREAVKKLNTFIF